MALTPVSEEYLEAVFFVRRDDGLVRAHRLAEFLLVSPATVSQTVRRLVRQGYLSTSERKEIDLTETGEELARGLIRRHYLIERWLIDVLGIAWSKGHAEAFHLERAMSSAVLERLAQALGNPKTCPHGNPLPGEEGLLSGQGFPLAQTQEGDEVVVERVTEWAEQDSQLLDHLERNGVLPGASLRILEVAPRSGTLAAQRDDRAFTLGLPAAAKIAVRPAGAGEKAVGQRVQP